MLSLSSGRFMSHGPTYHPELWRGLPGSGSCMLANSYSSSIAPLQHPYPVSSGCLLCIWSTCLGLCLDSGVVSIAMCPEIGILVLTHWHGREVPFLRRGLG